MIDQSQWPALEMHQLADGRQLAFRRIGAKDGTPLLFFHGTPGSHLLAFIAQEAAQKYGFTLICPDRPGMGDSSYQENRELHHYPLDIVQLLHHLNIPQCGVMAISGGSPYALQCAHDLPHAITHVTSLSGWVSYGRPELENNVSLSKEINRFRKLYRYLPFLVPVLSPLSAMMVKHFPQKIMQHLQESLPPADLELLKVDAHRELFVTDLQNAYQQGGKGPAREGKLQFRKPLFALKAIKQPTLLLHGTSDSVVPYEMAVILNQHLPNVEEFITIDAGGHLCAIENTDRIFAMLKAREAGCND